MGVVVESWMGGNQSQRIGHMASGNKKGGKRFQVWT